jgi:hypothetical protein
VASKAKNYERMNSQVFIETLTIPNFSNSPLHIFLHVEQTLKNISEDKTTNWFLNFNHLINKQIASAK